MLDLRNGEDVETLYKLIQIKGGRREEKFQSTDLKSVLGYHKWYVARYKEGLLLEIFPQKKVYDWKEKKVSYTFE